MSDTTDDGLGHDGTIPATDDGIAVGIGEQSSFEPEEDEAADNDASIGTEEQASGEPMTS